MSDDGEAPREPYVCETCGRVLDRHPQGWVHSVGDAEVGHDPVPVPQSQALVVAGRCDFCYADYPPWVVPAREFAVMPGHMSSGDWAACDECAALIERDQWSALVRRARAGWEARHGPMDPAAVANLPRMYRLLRRHITGSLKENPAVRAGRGGSAAKYGQGWKASPPTA
jgi:hypothetical protein